mgnify:CR=1 FL=1
MQVIDQRLQKTSITVSSHIKERVCALKLWKQTYYDVLNTLLNTVDTGDKGEEHGVVFLHMVYVNGEFGELHKLTETANHSEDANSGR